MLTTSMPTLPAYVSASTEGCRKKYPESWPARRLTIVALGATPAMPMPLIGEAMVDATCVPWPFSSTSLGSLHDWSGSAAHGPSIARTVGVDRDVDREVPAQLSVEVGRDVRVRAVDTRVEDPDQHALLALLELVRAVGGGADLLHVPLQVGERLGVRSVVSAALAVRGRTALELQVGLGRIELLTFAGVDDEIGGGADDLVLGGPHEGVLRVGGGGEVAVGRDDGGDTDVGVLGDDRPAGGFDRGVGGVDRYALGVDDDKLLFTGFLQGAGVVGRALLCMTMAGVAASADDRCPKDEFPHE